MVMVIINKLLKLAGCRTATGTGYSFSETDWALFKMTKNTIKYGIAQSPKGILILSSLICLLEAEVLKKYSEVVQLVHKKGVAHNPPQEYLKHSMSS
jgi:hypothetical protein